MSVTPQCGHREVPAWLERLVQFSGPVPLTLYLQGWAEQEGGTGGWGKWGGKAVHHECGCGLGKRALYCIVLCVAYKEEGKT